MRLAGLALGLIGIAVVVMAAGPASRPAVRVDRIILRDVQGLFGGVDLWLLGDGTLVAQEVKGGPAGTRRWVMTLDARRLGTVLKSIDDHRFFDLTIRPRQGVPDEARPTITVQLTDGTEKTVAKWANDTNESFDAVYRMLLDVHRNAMVEGTRTYLGKWEPAWQPAAATQPATRPATQPVDTRTATLSEAIRDMIALLEGDDADTLGRRWATNEKVAGDIRNFWKNLKDCHREHDYRRWLAADAPRDPADPAGGANNIGENKAFKVGGHSFGHMHIDWYKTADGWRIAHVWMCR